MKRPVKRLVDDRCCQQQVLGESEAGGRHAFGTDVLLARLADDGSISAEQHANCVLQLIRWRYKFLVPPASVLLTMANRFSEGLPGKQLREISIYLQDCMRDTGLYGGPEKTDPPLPMAFKLFMAWIDVVASFVVESWWDDRFTEEQSARLTRWAVRYLLPAWPKNLVTPSWRRSGYSFRYALLSSVLTNLIWKDDDRKSYRVVNRIRRSMDINKDELAAVAESVVETMEPVYTEQAIGSIFVRILEIIYGQNSQCSWRLLPMADRLRLVDQSKSANQVSLEELSAIENRSHSNRLDPKPGPFAYILDGDHAKAIFLPSALTRPQTNLRRAIIDDLLPHDNCPKTTFTQSILDNDAINIRAEAAKQWSPAVGRVLETLKEDFLLNMAGFAQAQQRQHDDGLSICWNHLIQPTVESLLALDSDGCLLLPHSDDQEGKLEAILKDTTSLQDMLEKYDQLVGHMSLAAPLDLGSRLRIFIETNNNQKDAWPFLEGWLRDKSRPWLCYHACQALLSNINYVPEDQLSSFWQAVTEISELSQVKNNDSDDAQIWRMEAELAKHYLRTVDLGDYGLEANRPLTASWWAARAITELLTRSLPAKDVPHQVRKWRSDVVANGTFLTQEAWVWLSPKAYSPSRFVTLYSKSPRSIAILINMGDFARAHGLDLVPPELRSRLMDGISAALLTGDLGQSANDNPVWMWDQPLVAAAEAFMSALPEKEKTQVAAQTLEAVKRLSKVESIKEAMKQVETANEIDAIFLCSRIRLFCYEHVDAADVIIEYLRDEKWRNTCATKIPTLGWELLAQGLLFLQSRQGVQWDMELPYIFMNLAETSSGEEQQAVFFLISLIMSSLTGNTAGAVKSLAKSSAYQDLKPAITKVRDAVESLRQASPPEIALRLQGICTILEQLR